MTVSYTQPLILPFPANTTWRLFICTCWREKMRDGLPEFPAHIEATAAIVEPSGGEALMCGKCRSIWFYRKVSGNWLRLENLEFAISGSERLALYMEGVANEALESDAPAGETTFDHPSQKEEE